jgi:hypothetical protein
MRRRAVRRRVMLAFDYMSPDFKKLLTDRMDGVPVGALSSSEHRINCHILQEELARL